MGSYVLYPTQISGIGRTGVLILMESALYLVEANQPVYPLDLTRIMRDQRASMIQTPAQYRFVCQAILKVYKEGHVKPLPEFASVSPAQSVKSDSCKKVATAATAVSIITTSSSASTNGSDVITNGSDEKDCALDKVTSASATVLDNSGATALNVVSVVVGAVDELPRPESPSSSQESSSAVAPLSAESS